MSLSIIMLGASGAVGTQALQALLERADVSRITVLGRSPIKDVKADHLEQHRIDIFEPHSYSSLLLGHDVAICTLGVGQPSKVSKEEFLKIDKQAVIDFARGCKAAGVRHFQLLASIGIDAESRSFYLRSKGELVEELKAMQFDRLSIFMPSMILTPSNRYGFSQAVVLKLWPILNPILIGSLRKYRGVKVKDLGHAIAANSFTDYHGVEKLSYQDFERLNEG